MRKLCLVFVALLILLAPAALRGGEPAEEQQMVGVLQSNATLRQKDAACAALKRIGTARAVPALAALLAGSGPVP